LEGPERQALEDLTQSLGIFTVRFGTLRGKELAGELQRHACMVVPSLWEEPFGIVALEGIACCDMVIVTQRGGLPEAVGNCGLVVEPTVEDIAAAMRSVVKARCSGMALPGRATEAARKEHLARHTPKSVTQQYLSVIEQKISHKPKRERK
jgi:glycosyltransferase involved in cell wall biosynthesis